MDERLLEPLNFYNSNLRNTHYQNVSDFFDELVTKSKVDVELNRKTVKKYKEKMDEISKLKDKIGNYGFAKVALIIIIIVGAYFFIKTISNMNNGQNSIQNLILSLVLVLAIGGSIYYLSQKVLPTIKDAKGFKEELEAEANKIKEECMKQLAPLNCLYDSDDTRKLMNKTLPDIVLDKKFEMERFDYLNGKYGLQDNNDVNTSSLKILSGEIVGNPYVIVKQLKHTLGTYVYKGSIVIHWETYYYDSDGNRQTQYHTQTLYAQLEKPKPYYSEYTTLMYGNESAPDLNFSRSAHHIEKLNDNQLQRYIKKESKKIHKKANESIKNGGNFTALGNEEFDALFGAIDRDNETQFRLLFTPLAQKNMVDILKNGKYGDDFAFTKRREINYVTGENSAYWDMNTNGNRFINFDIDDAKAKFIDFNMQYFDHYYFQIAPVLAIPLYQQHKPREYIYQHEYHRNYTSYQTEAMANTFQDEIFAHPDTKTRSIIKTEFAQKETNTDKVYVTAYSYNTRDRVTYIPVYGQDGRFHDVPVNWVEYIPLKKTSVMKVRDTKINDSEFAELRNYSEFTDYMNKNSAQWFNFDNGMLAMTSMDDQTGNYDDEIERLINNISSREE